MATSASGAFEEALRRLEEIVAKLDGENVSLEESVALFKEGKSLAQRCEGLLRSAQIAIETASRAPEAEPDASGATLFDARGRTT